MKTILTFLGAALLLTAHAAARTSANYSIPAESADAAGRRTASASYTNDGSLGGIAGLATVAAPAETAKQGYIGQLYEALTAQLATGSGTVAEKATLQLGAQINLDDATVLAVNPTTVTWSIVQGPIADISGTGLATAGTVNVDTQAFVSGAFDGYSAGASILVTNVTNLPVAEAKGSYTGLVVDPNAGVAGLGLLRLTIEASGRFTATLMLGGRTYRFQGAFDANGIATLEIRARNSAPLSIRLFADLDGGRQATGFIGLGTVNATFDADRNDFTHANPTPNAGAYTLRFSPTVSSSLIPQGAGFARLTVSPAGRVKVAGALADGTTISIGTKLGAGVAPLYKKLFNGGGAVAGNAQWVGGGLISGTSAWFRPVTSAKLFPSGFGTTLGLSGARYTAPARGTRAIPLGDHADNAVITLHDGQLGTPLVRSVTYTAANTVLVPGPNSEKLMVEIRPKSGLFKGSFRHPGLGTIVKFKGAILQSEGNGAGFFRAAPISGGMEIFPQ